MAKNFKLVIEYDGTRYYGWQRQKEKRTVQGEIIKVIHTITREKVDLTGSGRTDAGVHAYGQVANFISNTKHTIESLHKGFNCLLPEDIVIKSLEEVDASFHAQYNAKKKTYHYRILNTQLPIAIKRQYAWHIRKKLDLGPMQEAAGHLIGTHDFKSFENVGSPRKHTTRCITKAFFIEEAPDSYLFEIEGNGFLKYMVRNIIGTLVDVGTGKKSEKEFKKIMESLDRKNAGQTAPPHGLFLKNVEY